ncbi:MAG: hypothetical protein KGJ13_07030 [Patescibacteria group bacterium]|nr:hypothetical protein [Patescibacteria group bacterium]
MLKAEIVSKDDAESEYDRETGTTTTKAEIDSAAVALSVAVRESGISTAAPAMDSAELAESASERETGPDGVTVKAATDSAELAESVSERVSGTSKIKAEIDWTDDICSRPNGKMRGNGQFMRGVAQPWILVVDKIIRTGSRDKSR